MSQNRCYLCGSSDVGDGITSYSDWKSEDFYRFNNKLIYLCGNAKSGCFRFLRDKYGTHKGSLGLSDPNFYKSKTKGGFFSANVHQRYVTGEFKDDLRNNLDGLREEAIQAGQDFEQEEENFKEAVQKEFQIVLKRWDEVLTKILEQTNAKTTAKDIFKLLKKSKITKPTKLKALQWEMLNNKTAYSHHLQSDFELEFNENEAEIIDPYYIVNEDLPYSECFSEFSNEDALKMSLENRVFDPKSKIKRTGNFRYYLSSNEEPKEDKDIKTQLKELKALFDEELIDEDDYNKKKDQILENV